MAVYNSFGRPAVLPECAVGRPSRRLRYESPAEPQHAGASSLALPVAAALGAVPIQRADAGGAQCITYSWEGLDDN